MTKMQKVWLGIFLAMFIVPEVLWSPVGNFIYSIFLSDSGQKYIRNNFLVMASDKTLLFFVLSIELVGLLGSIILMFRRRLKTFADFFVFIIFSILFLLTLFVVYLNWATVHIGT